MKTICLFIVGLITPSLQLCNLNEGQVGSLGSFPYLFGTATYDCTLWSISTEFSASSVLVTGICQGAFNYGVFFEVDGMNVLNEK